MRFRFIVLVCFFLALMVGIFDRFRFGFSGLCSLLQSQFPMVLSRVKTVWTLSFLSCVRSLWKFRNIRKKNIFLLVAALSLPELFFFCFQTVVVYNTINSADRVVTSNESVGNQFFLFGLNLLFAVGRS